MKKFKFILFCLFFLISFYITGSKILNTSLINYLIYNEEQISSIKYNNMLKEISKNIVNNIIIKIERRNKTWTKDMKEKILHEI